MCHTFDICLSHVCHMFVIRSGSSRYIESRNTNGTVRVDLNSKGFRQLMSLEEERGRVFKVTGSQQIAPNPNLTVKINKISFHSYITSHINIHH